MATLLYGTETYPLDPTVTEEHFLALIRMVRADGVAPLNQPVFVKIPMTRGRSITVQLGVAPLAFIDDGPAGEKVPRTVTVL